MTPVEIRKLLDAVHILATRPAHADSDTIGEALGYFAKLIVTRTDGEIKVHYTFKGDRDESE